MTTVRLQGQGVAELYRRLQTPEGRVLIRSHQGGDLDLRTLMLDEGRRSGPVALIRSRSGEHGLALGLDSTNGAQAGLCVISPSSDEALPLHRQLRDVRSMIALVEPYLHSVEELTTVAYRPGRRLVVRLRGKLGEVGRVLYLKGLRRSRYRAQVANLSRLRSLSQADDLVLPIAHLDDACAFVFEEVVGESLHAKIARGEELDSPGLVAAIQRMGTIPSEVPNGPALEMRRWSVEQERSTAQAMLEKASFLLTELRWLHDVIDQVRLEDESTTSFLHGDLHDKQIIFTDGGPRFLDLDSWARGPGALDFVNLSEHLRLREMQGRGSSGATGPELLAEAGLSARDPRIVQLQLLTRARLAGVYGCRPHWWDLARRLATDCRPLIKG